MKKYMPLGALALAAAPLYATEPAAELFPRMAAELTPPVLTCSADALLYIRSLGEMVAPQCRNEERRKQIASIGQATLVAENGSAERLHAVLSVLMRLQQLSRTKEACKAWLQYAKPEYQALIQNTFETALAPKAAELTQLAEKAKLEPVHVSLVAAPGKEGDFDALHQAIATGLAAYAAKPDSQEAGIKEVEHAGYKGVEIPRASIFRKTGSMPLPVPEDVLTTLAEGSVYLLVKKEGDSISFVICSDPAAAENSPLAEFLTSLPTPAANLHGAAYLSPAMIQAYVDAAEQNNYDMLLGIVADVCNKMAATDAANAPVFTGASDGLKQLARALFPPIPPVQKPSYAIVSGPDDALELTLIGDAMGAHFEPGELRTVTLADAPELTLYAESTPLIFPNNLSELPSLSTCLGIVKAITLTMTEEEQDKMAQTLLVAETSIPKLTALGQALKTVLSGLGAPCSLVITQEPPVPNPMLPQASAAPQVALAMSAAVQNRAVLGEGWQSILGILQQECAQLGMPPEMLASFIIANAAGPNAAMNYSLFLPMLPPQTQLQLTVSDKSFVLGTHTGLSGKVSALQNAEPVPFRGAAARLNIDALVEVFEDEEACSPTNTFVGDSPLQQLLDGKSSTVSATLVDHDGFLILRWRVTK